MANWKHLFTANPLISKSCHPKKTIIGIQKGVALRLKRICSTDEDFKSKSIEYSKYLEKRGHKKSSVQKAFKNVANLSRMEARTPRTNSGGKTLIAFSTKYNPRGPNIKDIVSENLHILGGEFRKDVLVAYKRESNLKELLLRADPYQVKADLLDHTPHGYKPCNKTCDSCNNFVVQTTKVKAHATGRTFHLRRDSTCASKNVIYVAVCSTCGKQGVGSTSKWKPRLANYKSHIKTKTPTCRIVRHFIEECVDPTFKNLNFIIVDVVNNVDHLNETEIDDILLQKEKFWIGTLVTQHHGLKGKHDWKRKSRTEREKNLG